MFSIIWVTQPIREKFERCSLEMKCYNDNGCNYTFSIKGLELKYNMSTLGELCVND